MAEGDLTFTEIARRAQLVDAAIATLADSAEENATFARIAERAGFTSAAIIEYYFENRDEFEAEILAEIRRRLTAANRQH